MGWWGYAECLGGGRVETLETESRLKIGPRTPPGIQAQQFSEPRPAVATSWAPEGQKTSNLDPRGSRFRKPPDLPEPRLRAS